MRKIIIFTYWQVERLESYLENMERNGYRLDSIKYSYFFYFKESEPKEMQYFLSYQSVGGRSMSDVDLAIRSEHQANIVKESNCKYIMYRTKEHKDKMYLLYKMRTEYMKVKCFGYFLCALSVMIMFSSTFIIPILLSSPNVPPLSMMLFPVISGLLTIYYFIGYIKQIKKQKRFYLENK